MNGAEGTWLLVHPPLLGPAVLGPLAAELRDRGATVRLPDLRATVIPAEGWAGRWVAAAATSGPAHAVVGFSGAGIVLPAVAAAVEARRVIWLDAVVPAARGPAGWPEQIRQGVAALVEGDRIADWTTWWGPDAMADLLPDEGVRTAVLAEGHRLPADFYDQPVPVPDAWPDDDVTYVQLSPAYDADAAAARAREWRVVGPGDRSHLAVATDPVEVADLLA
ncbi:MAG TPA: hypothetical protein VHF92_11180 [Geodermatophilus sp.]|nr:hypothetical protein [Geodermatophilus sp.]